MARRTVRDTIHDAGNALRQRVIKARRRLTEGPTSRRELNPDSAPGGINTTGHTAAERADAIAKGKPLPTDQRPNRRKNRNREVLRRRM